MLNMSEISPQNIQAGPGCCPVHSTSGGPRLAHDGWCWAHCQGHCPHGPGMSGGDMLIM